MRPGHNIDVVIRAANEGSRSYRVVSQRGMRQRRRPPSCELGQLRPLQQIAQFVAAQAAVLHQAALARGYLSGADTHNTTLKISPTFSGEDPHHGVIIIFVMCSVNQNPNLNAMQVLTP